MTLLCNASLLQPGQPRSAARPAASCHLRYPLPPAVEECRQWELSCSVVVTASCSASYFCVVGWGPGGYSGIQEVAPGRKVAIFSMWNCDSSKVVMEEGGAGAQVDSFGGEGTGLRCLLPLDWEEGEEVRLVVRGEQQEQDWVCSGHVIHR